MALPPAKSTLGRAAAARGYTREFAIMLTNASMHGGNGRFGPDFDGPSPR